MASWCSVTMRTAAREGGRERPGRDGKEREPTVFSRLVHGTRQRDARVDPPARASRVEPVSEREDPVGHERVRLEDDGCGSLQTEVDAADRGRVMRRGVVCLQRTREERMSVRVVGQNELRRRTDVSYATLMF